jgi:hypothetical protein
MTYFDWMPKIGPTTRAQVFRMIATFLFFLLLAQWLQNAMLWGAAVLLFLIDMWSSVTLVHQRKLITRQHDIILEAVKVMHDTMAAHACSEWNLRRACAALKEAGIEFHPLVPPPMAAPDKEGMS